VNPVSLLGRRLLYESQRACNHPTVMAVAGKQGMEFLTHIQWLLGLFSCLMHEYSTAMKLLEKDKT
jgi:hypothetical protein